MPQERVLLLSKQTEKHLYNASRFLNTYLKKALANGQKLTPDFVLQNLDLYKTDNPEYSDFTLDQVWVTSLAQLSESTVAGIENCDVPDDITYDLAMFEALNKLKIDKSALKLLKDMHADMTVTP